MNEVPYYRVIPKNNRAYWCPSPAMKRRGFGVVSLGLDGPQAKQAAQEWNAKWRAERKVRLGHVGPREERSHPPAERRYVYFIQISDRVKIGVSWKPFARAASITGGAHGIFQKAIVVIGNRADEKRLHQRFASYRTNGEWFVASRPLLLTMHRCAAAGRVIHDGIEERTNGPEKLNRIDVAAVESQTRGGALSV